MSPRTPEFNVENQNGGPNFADGGLYFARRVHSQIQAFPTLNLGGRGVGAAVMIWTGSLFLCSSVGHGVKSLNIKDTFPCIAQLQPNYSPTIAQSIAQL